MMVGRSFALHGRRELDFEFLLRSLDYAKCSHSTAESSMTGEGRAIYSDVKYDRQRISLIITIGFTYNYDPSDN